MSYSLNEFINSEIENEPVIVAEDWSNFTQESLDGLPQVWTRGMLYFLLIFSAIALPWSIFFKVDETGTARGRLEPQGKTVKLDTPVLGTVSNIPIKEGDFVKPGELLLILDSQLVQTELRQEQDKLEGQLNRLAQLDGLKNQLIVALTTQQQQNQAQALEKQAQIEQVQQNLITLKTSYELQKSAKLTQVHQQEQTLANRITNNKLAASSLTSSQKELQRYQLLHKEGAIPETNVVEKVDIAREKQKLYEQSISDINLAKLQLTEQKNDYEQTLRRAKAEINQAYLRWKEQQSSYQTLRNSSKLAILKNEEQLKNLETEITTLKTDTTQTKAQIHSLQLQLAQRVVKSPVAGRVFQLPIQRPGAVVQPGSMVAEIAPENSPLIIRAQIATSESGSLKVGLPVKLKFDAYPFQEYGVIEGELTSISPTTSEVETPNGKVAVYNLEVSLKQNCMRTANQCISLRPGDTVTAEIIVRQRRIIDFLLDPFQQLQQGGLKL
jgi:hemolysin D